MTMMTYRNNMNEAYYDFTMIADFLNIHPSILKRELKQFPFLGDNMLKYKNRHLYSQDGVVDFVVYLTEKKLRTDLKRLEAAVEKLRK